MSPVPPDKAAVDRVFGGEEPARRAGDHGAATDPDARDHDRWLRENVPPHHF